MKTILFAVILTLTLFGCDSEPASTTGGVPPGDIVGRVELYDTLNRAMKDNSGVTVSIEGTSYTTISDASGSWTLNNIPTGTYVIILGKEGFTSKKIFNVQHTGNGTYYLKYIYYSKYLIVPFLRQIPKMSMSLIMRPFEPRSSYRDSVWVDSLGIERHQMVPATLLMSQYTTIFSSPQYGGFYPLMNFYFGKDSQINPQDSSSFDFVSWAQYSSLDSGVATVSTVYISRDELITRGFQPGTKVFFTSSLQIDNYYDAQQEKEIIYFVTPPEAKSFILP